jgi:LPXTG-site transpeptidase (sortase) family protein
MRRRDSSGTASAVSSLLMAGGLFLSLAVLLFFALDRFEARATLKEIASTSVTTVAAETTVSEVAPPTAAPITLPTAMPGANLRDESQQPSSGFGPVASTSKSIGNGLQASAEGSQPLRIVIPGIGVDAPIERVRRELREEDGQRYYQWQLPSGAAAGWHENSALLGQPGNTVLNGHNNLRGSVFRNLIDLEAGDEIILYDDERPHVYRVTEQVLVEEKDQPLRVRFENARFMLPTSDERLTLITCWPYTSNSHRVIVIAVPGGDGDI